MASEVVAYALGLLTINALMFIAVLVVVWLDKAKRWGDKFRNNWVFALCVGVGILAMDVALPVTAK